MKKYENFVRAYSNLGDIFDYNEPYDNVALTGLVGLFEVCFEQAWKAMKEILEENGYDESRTGSPKQILKTAYAANMIQNEEMWLDALVARNNVAHSYNEEIAYSIVNKTKQDFYKLFGELKQELENNWVEEGY